MEIKKRSSSRQLRFFPLDYPIEVNDLTPDGSVAGSTPIKKNVNNQYKVQHPTKSFIDYIDIVTIYGPPTITEADYNNVHIFSNKQSDRSTGGTSTTAMEDKKIGR